MISANFPSGGLYVLPSKDSSLIWNGVIFVRAGLLKDGIFRFALKLESDFPKNQKNAPVIILRTPICHPLISSDLNFDSSSAFPSWNSESDHIYELLKFFKYALENIDYCCCNQLASVPNIEALEMYQKNRQQFIETSRDCVKQSIEEIYSANSESDKHFLSFEKYDQDIHGAILQNIKSLNNLSDDNISSIFDRRG